MIRFTWIFILSVVVIIALYIAITESQSTESNKINVLSPNPNPKMSVFTPFYLEKPTLRSLFYEKFAKGTEGQGKWLTGEEILEKLKLGARLPDSFDVRSLGYLMKREKILKKRIQIRSKIRVAYFVNIL